MHYIQVSCGLKIVNRKNGTIPCYEKQKKINILQNNYNQSELLLLFNNFVMEWKGWSAMEEVENGE